MNPSEKIYGQHIDRDPRLITEAYLDLGDRSAVAQAKFHYLSDMQKVILAEIKLEKWEKTQTETGKKISLELAETMALASPDYREHIEKLKDAREASYMLVNQFRCEDKTLELLRSLESSAKAYLSKLG